MLVTGATLACRATRVKRVSGGVPVVEAAALRPLPVGSPRAALPDARQAQLSGADGLDEVGYVSAVGAVPHRVCVQCPHVVGVVMPEPVSSAAALPGSVSSAAPPQPLTATLAAPQRRMLRMAAAWAFHGRHPRHFVVANLASSQAPPHRCRRVAMGCRVAGHVDDHRIRLAFRRSQRPPVDLPIQAEALRWPQMHHHRTIRHIEAFGGHRDVQKVHQPAVLEVVDHPATFRTRRLRGQHPGVLVSLIQDLRQA